MVCLYRNTKFLGNGGDMRGEESSPNKIEQSCSEVWREGNRAVEEHRVSLHFVACIKVCIPQECGIILGLFLVVLGYEVTLLSRGKLTLPLLLSRLVSCLVWPMTGTLENRIGVSLFRSGLFYYFELN